MIEFVNTYHNQEMMLLKILNMRLHNVMKTSEEKWCKTLEEISMGWVLIIWTILNRKP